MPSLSCENAIVAVLYVTGFDQKRHSRDFREGECLSVGSDESADICLIDDRVSATHCMIIAKGGVVTVRDCFSESGTFVNEARIREFQLTANAAVRVGATTIEVALSESVQRDPRVEPSRPLSAKSDERDVSQTRIESMPVAAPEETAMDCTLIPEAESSSKTIDALQMQLDQAHAEIEVLQTRLTARTSVVVSESDPYQDEMIELLRAEVVDLQAALANREQGVTDSMSGTEENSDGEETLSRSEAETLVERLEQLLQELQQRDEQVSTLTELLQAAEEANRAEQDERHQVDAWLRDIEGRFGDREQEWRSQSSKLQAELEAVVAERDRAELAMNAETSNTKFEASQKVMLGLRETVESQRLQLQAAEQTMSELRSELDLSRRPIEREEMVRLAEERSEIARLRQELETARQHQNAGVATSEENLKFRALRQHLNEIHEQERKEREERKLSSRISRLWSRLEGR